jgi:hypothetical protein
MSRLSFAQRVSEQNVVYLINDKDGTISEMLEPMMMMRRRTGDEG